MTRVVNIAQSGGNNVTMRNRVINGAMMIDQRNAGASVTVSVDYTYGVDRFNGSKGGSTNNFTMQQSTTAPTGFKNSVVLTMGTGVSVGTTNYALFAQAIEGQNLTDFNLGSSSAISFTLSFWVRSSVTGTFGVSFRNGASSATYCSTYTINAANTFEYKTVTVPAGAINGGTWLTTNGIGMSVIWDLGVGSTYRAPANQLSTGANYFGVTGCVNLCETTGATFYITGVQLEAGTTATPFEQRLYGTELALCQRYYLKDLQGSGVNATFLNGVVDTTGSCNRAGIRFPVAMRASPTASYSTGVPPRIYDGSSALNVTSIVANVSSPFGASLGLASSSGLSIGRAAVIIDNTGGGTGSPCYFDYSAEL